MSLRISATQDAGGTTLTVSGRLVGPWIAELVRSFNAATGAIVVDISDVSFAASDGVDVLRGFLERGASVRGCPAYLLAQLEGTR